MTRRYRVSDTAQADIRGLLAWAEDQFGESARRRYSALLLAALRDIAEHPDRPGSIERPELGLAVRSWHLRMSRKRTQGGKVARPRHFLVYRCESDLIVVGRVLHDSMEVAAHLHWKTTWD